MGSGSSHIKRSEVTIEKSERNFNNRSLFAPFEITNAEQTNIVSTDSKNLINLIWFDSRSVPHDDITDTQITKEKLSNAITNAKLDFAVDKNACITFLQEQQNTIGIVFLIVSGQDSTNLFNNLNDDLYRRIDSIFIFCLSKKTYEAHLQNKKKVVGIYTEHNALLQAIQGQAILLKQQDIIIQYYTKTQRAARIVPIYAKGEFVWIRAMKEACLQTEKTDKVMKQMLDRFRLVYRRDMIELKKIDEFEKNYHPNDAINWYTRDSFLYRIINQSLRTQNTNELVIFSPYIADLCRAVQSLQNKVDKTMTFFRGCPLPKTAVDEFYAQIGSLLSINSFFSATCDRDVAIVFSSCEGITDGTNTIVSALFEIEVKEGTRSFFADISSFSSIKDEKEVLFDLNAVFTIDSVNYNDAEQCWIIHLTTGEETYMQHTYIYKELCEACDLNSSPVLTVGLCLMMMGHTWEAYRHANSFTLTYNSKSQFNIFFIRACFVECNYARAIRFLIDIYEICEKCTTYEFNHGWTTVACWLVNILVALGEYERASQYILSIPRYYRAIKSALSFRSNSFEAPMRLEYLDDLGKALVKNNEVEVNRLLLEHIDFEQMSQVQRALILPAAHVRLARSYVTINAFKEAHNHLQQAEIEGQLLLCENSLIRLDIYFINACINLYIKKFGLCVAYLIQAEKIARLNLSRACSSNLGCIYLLAELMYILQEKSFTSSIPLARIAFLRASDYIDVPKVAFTLSNICKIHKLYSKESNSPILNRLNEFIKIAFQICRFEQILEGKSDENVYRPLLHYVQQVPTDLQVESSPTNC